jgi:homocitrate synthase NifV
MKGLIDSTLREGSQMVGVSFSLEDKLAILKGLENIGVEELEIGVATRYDRDLPELLRQCRAINFGARLALWCLCRSEDIACAAALKPDVISLSIPGSDLHISKKLHKSREWVLATVSRSIKQARESGLGYISLGIEDATRTDATFLEEIITTAQKAGANRIRLADTVGVATPLRLADQVSQLKAKFEIEIGVHCHNDFGMATANSLTALESGADYADITVLGIGERAGNARLEEVVGFLALRNSWHYKTTALKPLAELLAVLVGQEISLARPVIGASIFHCESGLHLQGLRKDASTYEPFAPEKVGTERQLLMGAKIGKREIRNCLEPMGIILPCKQLKKLVCEVRKRASNFRRPLREKEFHSLIASCHESGL